MQPITMTNSDWLEFQKEIRGEVKSMNKKLDKLRKGQKKSIKLLHRVIKLLYNLNDNVEGPNHYVPCELQAQDEC